MRYENLTAADLMTTNPVTVSERDTIEHAEGQMHRLDIRHLPVVDDRGHLRGILSDRDIYKAVGTGKRMLGPVRDIMTPDVLTVAPTTLAREATALMLDHKIGAIPVVDRAAHLVGMITETDFLRVAHELFGGALMSDDED